MSERTTDPVEILQHLKGPDGKGGICIYAWHWTGNSWFEVATDVCSRDDVYNDALAEEMVRSSAMNYQTIKLPLRSDSDRFHLTVEQLESILNEVFTTA